jgi:hypothetical protein
MKNANYLSLRKIVLEMHKRAIIKHFFMFIYLELLPLPSQIS